MLLLGCGAIGLLFVRRKTKSEPPKAGEPELLPAVPERLEAQFIAKRQQILQVLDRELWCVFDGRIVVQDILTECPTTVRPDTTIATVRSLLQKERIHHVLVVDVQGQLLGVISDRDFSESKGATAAAIMSRRPESVGKTTPVVNAISLMLDRSISCLPVVDDRRVVGIVTSSDMLMTLQCCVQLLQRLASAMWQPGVTLGQSWSKESLPADASTASGDATGRFFDVMNAMSSHS